MAPLWPQIIIDDDDAAVVVVDVDVIIIIMILVAVVDVAATTTTTAATCSSSASLPTSRQRTEQKHHYDKRRGAARRGDSGRERRTGSLTEVRSLVCGEHIFEKKMKERKSTASVPRPQSADPESLRNCDVTVKAARLSLQVLLRTSSLY